MNALSRSKSVSTHVRIRSSVVAARLVAHGLPRVRAEAELNHDAQYRLRVLEVIREELSHARVLSERSSVLVREPERYYAARSSQTLRRVSPTTRYLLSLSASVCYIVDRDTVASVVSLSPVVREEVRALEGLPHTLAFIDPRLNPTVSDVPERPEPLRAKRLPARIAEGDADLKIFIVDGDVRGRALVDEAGRWLRLIGFSQRQVFFDPHVSIDFMRQFEAEELCPVSLPPDVEWDALRGAPLPYKVQDWWDRFCAETHGLRRATLVAFPALAEAILETLHGSEDEEWRRKPHLLRPGTLVKLKPYAQDAEWLRWEFFMR